MDINGKTLPLGLFGYPVKHTASPAMHNAGFQKLNLNYVYLPFSVTPLHLKLAIRSLIPLQFKGINVTIPHKQSVCPLLDELSCEAALIGAVNTLEIKAGKLIGHNTDALGFIESLKQDAKFSLKNKNLFLLGAGGAGHAVAFAAALQGAKKIFIKELNRKQAKLLKNKLTRNFLELEVEYVTENKTNRLKAALKEADILVNATPLGMGKKDLLIVNEDFLRPGLLVYDLVYNPLETRLLAAAKKKKCRVVSGIGMLLFQGIKAFEIWTGKKAPALVMKKALLKAIKQKAR